MAQYSAKRLDHLGIVAGTIQDLKLVELIDNLIPPDPQEILTTGEIVSAMIYNGLGFVSRPLSLTPQFFESKAVEALFDKEITHENLNRHKLGRVLDKIHAFGCETLFSCVAKQACTLEAVSTKIQSLDTTSFSFTGEYGNETDEGVVEIKHGYSKDHRPDLKQVVLELMVSQDGSIPLLAKTFDGNESDTEIFKKRAKGIIENFKAGEEPPYLVADSKLYCEKNAENLAQLKYITRIPNKLNEVGDLVETACGSDGGWEKIDDHNQVKVFEKLHYEIDQRWVVVKSEKALAASEKSINKKVSKEKSSAEKQLKSFKKQKFGCQSDALKAVQKTFSRLYYHELSEVRPVPVIQNQGRGRPKKDGSTPQKTFYEIQCDLVEKKSVIDSEKTRRSCFVIGTNIESSKMSAGEVVSTYKAQSGVERGFRFLKDPYFFASSLFLKKNSRIMGLLMVMTLSLLVYSIAQRRLRKDLKEASATLPNQINKEIDTPTMRWIFQILEGINIIYIRENGKTRRILDRLTVLKERVLRSLSKTIQSFYGLSPGKMLRPEFQR